MEPYCQGIYIIHKGSIEIVYRDIICQTLMTGDSFGESLILKQPVSTSYPNLDRASSTAATWSRERRVLAASSSLTRPYALFRISR